MTVQRGWRLRSERGSVAAEFAAAMPAVVLVLSLCLGAVVSASTHVRAQDAAGEAARLAARGDSPDPALQIAGGGASVSTWDAGEFRCAEVVAPIRIGGIAIGLTAQASSCALRDVDA